MIPDEVIEQVRDSADLIGIIGESVNLKRTGSDFRGPCPFHGGKSRNFAVIPKRAMYYCFVCHESGDVFRWLMKRFGMDYPTAVREIARRSGIVIPESTARGGPDPLEPLYGVVAAAQDWFARQLLERADAKGARDYLAGRDISIEQAAQHGLGWAPGSAAPGAFFSAMGELGIGESQLLECGLAVRRDDGPIGPRFRGRLLFPIHELRGRVVGFGGRLLGAGEPKYLNSPESAVFHKGRLLYNLHQARNAVRQEQSVILVEGYFDVLRLVLAGIDHVVAPLGTGLTSDQGALLRRFAPAAILLYDSDEAGLKATFRAGDELLRHGVRVKVATMPPGEDPDTLVRTGGAAGLAPLLHDAMDVLERKIQLLEQRGWFDKVERRREALDKLLPTIRAAADPVMRELYTSRAAERVGVPREVVADEAARGPAAASARATGPGHTQGPAQGPGAVRAPTDTRARETLAGPAGRTARFGARAERQLIRSMLVSSEWREVGRRELTAEWFETPVLGELYAALVRLPAADPGSQLPEGLSGEASIAWAELRDAAAGLTAEQASEDYVSAQQTLAARPEYRAIVRLTDPTEKARRLAALDARFPAFARKRGYVRSGQQARHRQPRR
jgi:DNA primase